MNITIEGIGDDATLWGFGILLRNALTLIILSTNITTQKLILTKSKKSGQ